MAYAEHFFRHASTLGDGAEAGDHIDSAQRQLARMPGRKRPQPNGPLIPEPPPFPEPLDYLWQIFELVSMGMPISGMAPAVISWDTLQAWESLTNTALEPWEAQTVVQLSMMRAGIQSETRRNQTTVKDPPTRPPAIGKRSR